MARPNADRRSFLGAVATGVGTGLAGCLGVLGDDSSGDGSVSGDLPDEWWQFGAGPRNRSAVAGGPGPDVERRWTATLPDPEDADFVRRWHASPVSDGDCVYLAGKRSVVREDETTGTGYVAAVGVDGTLAWRTSLAGPPGGKPLTPAVVDGRVLVARGGSLRTLPAAGGDPRSRVDLDPGPFSAPAVTGGEAYVGSVTVRKVSADATERRWLYEETAGDGEPLPSTRLGGPAVADGSVYLPVGDRLLAVSTGGERRWLLSPDVEFPELGEGRVHPPAVGPDGTVYATTGDFANFGSGTLLAVDPDGSTRWTFRPEGDGRRQGVYGTPAVADGTVYVCGVTGTRGSAGERRLYALDPGGSLRWSVRTGVVDLAPVVAGGTVYLAGGPPDEGRLVAVDGEGTVRTRTPIDRADRLFSRSAAVVGDLLVVPTREGLVAYGPA